MNNQYVAGMGTARFGEVVTRSHFPALDGLRAIAVFMVIVGHAGYPIVGVPGDLGVSAFFVLSGFLITRLLMRERAASGAISLSQFYARRTLRIFPAYYAFLLFSFTLDYIAGDHWSRALGLSAVTYTVNYFNAFRHHPSTSVAHAWSLSVEEQFYLLWPLMFMLLARRGRRALVGGVLTMAAVALVWRSWLALVSHADVAYLYNAFDTRFDNLAVGCVLALIADHEWVGNAAEAMVRRSWYPLVVILLLWISRARTPEAYHYSVGFTVDAMLVAILIAQLMQVTGTPLWSWLDWRVTRYLGTISYPLYLYHAWGDAAGRHAPVPGRALKFAIAIAATILMASGSYYVIERPFLKLKKRFQPKSATTIVS